MSGFTLGAGEESITLSVARSIIGCSRPTAYMLAARGELRTVRVGTLYLTTRAEAARVREVFQARRRERALPAAQTV